MSHTESRDQDRTETGSRDKAPGSQRSSLPDRSHIPPRSSALTPRQGARGPGGGGGLWAKPSWRPRASQVRELVMGLQAFCRVWGGLLREHRAECPWPVFRHRQTGSLLGGCWAVRGRPPGPQTGSGGARDRSGAVREPQPGLKERTSQSLDMGEGGCISNWSCKEKPVRCPEAFGC